MTLFDYLDAFLTAYFNDTPSVEVDHSGEFVPSLSDSGLEAVFGGLSPDTLALATGLPHPSEQIADGPLSGVDGAGGSPADAWLSGHEWSGEAELGGDSLTSGTWDTSGEGNHVISVDGEVLDLP